MGRQEPEFPAGEPVSAHYREHASAADRARPGWAESGVCGLPCMDSYALGYLLLEKDQYRG